MSVILRMRAAAFTRDDATTVGPFELELHGGQRAFRECASPQEAAALAVLAAAIARPTSGSVTVADYDSRIQPAQCKRLAAYIPHDPLPMSRSEFDRHVEYRAALWNVDAARARAYAAGTLDALAGVHEAFAYPFAAATIGRPQLLVLDRPPSAYVEAMLAACGPAAVLVARVAGDAA